ncbi:unnamed protein product [Ceratitis capitata]|uniref:(Mediterranean fruit fly) hypothetical protein n=1 Tax=Ceratitis capitata TaxID=7213 RepID=A0A811V2S6_CERCA|nr:unnamed protein product [Ceratitis capitata]
MIVIVSSSRLLSGSFFLQIESYINSSATHSAAMRFDESQSRCLNAASKTICHYSHPLHSMQQMQMHART